MTSISPRLRLRRAARLFTATTTLIACMWAPATAQSERAEYPIEGTWAVHVTPYNCATGVPFPGFYGIASFDRGGTATSSTPGRRHPRQRRRRLGSGSMAAVAVTRSRR